MSLLICTICEENREPVAKTLKEASEILGTKATGHVIPRRHDISPSTNFTIDLVEIFNDDNLKDISFSGKIDEEGNFEILAPYHFIYGPKFSHYNHLFIMNKVIEYIKNL